MSIIDFAGARACALTRLERELSPNLVYHAPAHTFEDVLPAVERLAGQAGVAGHALLLLRTAAIYHDIGYVERIAGHEAAGARIAAETLPHFGYTPRQIATIVDMILATRMPQSPRTGLAALLADADLDSLGRDDFLSLSIAFRAELLALGQQIPEPGWYRRQAAFLRSHRYWTRSARACRDAGKRANIAVLQHLLASNVERRADSSQLLTTDY